MQVDMYGLRNNLANAYDKTATALVEVTESCDEIRRHPGYNDLWDGICDLRQMIAGLLCTYSMNPDDKMPNMSARADRLVRLNDDDDDEDDDEDEDDE